MASVPERRSISGLWLCVVYPGFIDSYCAWKITLLVHFTISRCSMIMRYIVVLGTSRMSSNICTEIRQSSSKARSAAPMICGVDPVAGRPLPGLFSRLPILQLKNRCIDGTNCSSRLSKNFLHLSTNLWSLHSCFSELPNQGTFCEIVIFHELF